MVSLLLYQVVPVLDSQWKLPQRSGEEEELPEGGGESGLQDCRWTGRERCPGDSQEELRKRRDWGDHNGTP